MAEDADEFVRFAAVRARPLLRTAWVLTGDWHLAQDVVQETLARMFQHWRRTDKIENTEAYANVVLVRTYLSMRRRRSFFERPTHEFAEITASSPDPALRVTVEAALAELSANDRAVLVLRYLCDRSVEQVAIDLNRSPTAVRSMSKRALDRLRTILDPEGARHFLGS